MTNDRQTVADDDILFRRIMHYYITPDHRISSAAFKTRRKKIPDSVSVDIARLTTSEQCLARGTAGQRIIRTSARIPRSFGLQVVHDPVPDNPAHAEIRGEFTLEICARLAEASEIEV